MTLLLHTSTPTVHLGFADGGRIVAQESSDAGRDLVATLAEKIWKFVQKSPHPTPDSLHPLTKIVVHAGPASAKATAGRPGSFTGIRLGVTTANTLAYALKIPVIGISGEVPDLASLFASAKTARPAPGGIALPAYGGPPKLGKTPT